MKLWGILFVLAALPVSLSAAEAALKVFAAASLSNVLTGISNEYGSAQKITFNFDGTSKLAKQIESGAPADLFFSADDEWMDYLAGKNKIDTATRVDLASNKIVVVVPSDSNNPPARAVDLASEHYRHIALAGEAVPAGRFARSALKSEGTMTEAFAKKIVNADNVRVALNWVSSHDAEAGIVYSTDALIEPKVKVAFVFKDGSYPKIRYPAAVLTSSRQAQNAKAFLDFCRSEKAKEIFKKAGFILL
jgi:molybdate transport system substrate-binding protein